MDLLSGLNPPQRQAVVHVDGPLLILAGAGSGKTRVITHRIGHLVRESGVKPWSILAVTFTNKAAGEMRERVQRLLTGAGGAAPLLSTFHSFCVRLLRRDGERLAEIRPGFKRDFLIYDDDDQLRLIKAIYRDLEIDDKQFLPHRGALSAIGTAKSEKKGPSDILTAASDPKSRLFAEIYNRYEARLRQANALDFDDLLLEAVRLLRHDKDVRHAWNEKLHYVMVDEYQDTNRSQYELMQLLTYARKNVCVVGDEDQSIYSWRGADIKNILDFEKDYPNAVTIRLEQNYRSTRTILAAAGAVVAHNAQRKGKVLWSDGEQGSKITLYTAADADQEGLYIAERINRFLNGDSTLRVAVLYRTNAQSRLIEEGLRRYGRTYQVVGGTSFYQRAEIKDVLAYLKLSLNHGDSVSLLRILNTPARGIGKSTVEMLEAHAVKQGMTLWDAIADALAQNLLPPRAAFAVGGFRRLIEEFARLAKEARPGVLLREIVSKTGYAAMLEKNVDPSAESRLENVQELVNAAEEAGERGETIADFLDHAALVAEADSIDARSQVLLMTAHNAKGLEFPVVFLAGMEEGLLPHSRSRDSVEMLEEERRLCYVAMTRAERHLILSWAQTRRRWGGGSQEPSAPSRFLRELPEELVEPKGETSRSRLKFDDEPEGDFGVDLFVERHEVRRAERKPWPGSSYNSVENIEGFFRQRGLNPPPPKPQPPAAPARREPSARKPAGRGIGASVLHPSYGTGTVLRVEGDDDEDAKLTVQFPGYGLKKIIRKYAKFKN